MPTAAAQSEPRSPIEKRPKRLTVCVDGSTAGSVSPRPAAKPAYSRQSSSPTHGSFTYPGQRRSRRRVELNVDDVDDDRPRSCDAMIPETTRPILALDHHHDCSAENVRSFVSGMAQRRSGAPVVGGRTGCSTEVLLEMVEEDVAETAGRKSVRFAPVVRVCDQTSTITYCHLRHQSASSAPAVLGGWSCSLPTLSSGGCVGSGSQSPNTTSSSSSSRGDKLDLAATVDRYMVCCERQRQHLDDADRLRSDDVHRFPPLRHRRT